MRIESTRAGVAVASSRVTFTTQASLCVLSLVACSWFVETGRTFRRLHKPSVSIIVRSSAYTPAQRERCLFLEVIRLFFRRVSFPASVIRPMMICGSGVWKCDFEPESNFNACATVII